MTASVIRLTSAAHDRRASPAAAPRPDLVSADLLDRAHLGLVQACQAPTATERFALAHLAALRAAAAVLAASARRAPGSAPRNVWLLLPRVAPEFCEWADFFAATAQACRRHERGVQEPSVRDADDLVRQVEHFAHLVLAYLGLPMATSVSATVAPVTRA